MAGTAKGAMDQVAGNSMAMGVSKNGWFMFMSGKAPSFERDDWGYPYDETETSMYGAFTARKPSSSDTLDFPAMPLSCEI